MVVDRWDCTEQARRERGSLVDGVRVTRFMSWLLRHAPERRGLWISPGGWAAMADVHRAVIDEFDATITFEDIRYMARDAYLRRSYEPRFATIEREGRPWLRATCRHSFAHFDPSQVDNFRWEELATAEPDPEHCPPSSVDRFRHVARIGAEDLRIDILQRDGHRLLVEALPSGNAPMQVASFFLWIYSSSVW